MRMITVVFRLVNYFFQQYILWGYDAIWLNIYIYIYVCVCACTLGIQSLVQLGYHCDNIPNHHVPVMQGHSLSACPKRVIGGIHGLNRCGVNLAGFPCRNSKIILYTISENPAFIDDLIIFNHWIVQVKAANMADLTPPQKKKRAPHGSVTEVNMAGTGLGHRCLKATTGCVCVCLISVNVNGYQSGY